MSRLLFRRKQCSKGLEASQGQGLVGQMPNPSYRTGCCSTGSCRARSTKLWTCWRTGVPLYESLTGTWGRLFALAPIQLQLSDVFTVNTDSFGLNNGRCDEVGTICSRIHEVITKKEYFGLNVGQGKWWSNTIPLDCHSIQHVFTRRTLRMISNYNDPAPLKENHSLKF